jgi:hypothetical protein
MSVTGGDLSPIGSSDANWHRGGVSEKTPAGDDAELEREIRTNRTFSLSDAIGRMAGGGVMKGASPITATRQAQLAIEEYLRCHLTDAGGVLGRVLLRDVGQSARLCDEQDPPLSVLADFVRTVLQSEYLLRELVREADMEWGQALGERPYFERTGQPPHPDDPYTLESVRCALSGLAEALAKAGT